MIQKAKASKVKVKKDEDSEVKKEDGKDSVLLCRRPNGQRNLDVYLFMYLMLCLFHLYCTAVTGS